MLILLSCFNTNSSLLLIGLNGGKNIPFNNKKWFTSLYSGGGYLNIGESRGTIDNVANIAKQDVARKSSVFARGAQGLRIKPNPVFLNTLF